MNKKSIAIMLELVPLLSAVMSFILIVLPYESKIVKSIIGVTTLLSLFGFIFFFIGRSIDRKDKIVRVLGILDWFSFVYVIVLYTIVIFSFGL